MTSMIGREMRNSFCMSGIIMTVPFRSAICLALILRACGSQQQPVQHTVQHELQQKAQEAVHEEDTRKAIAAFGDSISAGFGVEPGKSYPDDLQRLIDQGGYKYRIVNLGVSGDT